MPLHNPVAAPPPTATRQSAPRPAAFSTPRRTNSTGTWLMASGRSPTQRSPSAVANRSPIAVRPGVVTIMARRPPRRSTSAPRWAALPGPNTIRGGVALCTPAGWAKLRGGRQPVPTTVRRPARPSCCAEPPADRDVWRLRVRRPRLRDRVRWAPASGCRLDASAWSPHVVVPTDRTAHLLLDHEVRSAHREVQRGRARDGPVGIVGGDADHLGVGERSDALAPRAVRRCG